MVLAARAGDPEAFAALYERYYATLVWLAYAVVLDRDWAEDIAQQTFVKACEKLADLRKPERFSGWLTRICRNTAHQAVRDRKRLSIKTAEPAACASDTLAEREERRQIVKAAVDCLPAMYREIVVLHYYHHQSYEQLRHTLGLSDHSVRGRLFRARRKMERYLVRQGFGGGLTS